MSWLSFQIVGVIFSYTLPKCNLFFSRFSAPKIGKNAPILHSILLTNIVKGPTYTMFHSVTVFKTNLCKQNVTARNLLRHILLLHHLQYQYVFVRQQRESGLGRRRADPSKIRVARGLPKYFWTNSLSRQTSRCPFCAFGFYCKFTGMRSCKSCHSCQIMSFKYVFLGLRRQLRCLAEGIELGRLARPGRQTGIRLYRPVPPEGQNKSWGHRLTAKAITYQGRHQNNK
jgi:hypothetical protein